MASPSQRCIGLGLSPKRPYDSPQVVPQPTPLSRLPGLEEDTNSAVASKLLYRAAPKRWRMLAILCVDICVSYLPWYTFVPIMSQGMAVYGVLSQDLNSLCILYSLVYVPGVFLSGKLLTALGCRRCFILATGCLAVGCALRCGLPPGLSQVASGTSFLGWTSPFACLLAGQVLCAAGQTFLVNATSHLAAEWFHPDERPAAAMISNLMNFIGGSLSFVVPTWFVDPASGLEDASQQVSSLLQAQLLASLVALLLTALFYWDAPSSMSLKRPVEPLFSEVLRVLSLRDFWLINFQFAIYLTVMNTFDAIEGALLLNYGYSEALSSWTAVLFGATSVLSTLLEAAVIRHPVYYGKALVGANCLLAASCVSGLCSLALSLPGSCFVLAVGVMGFSSPGWGCSLEMGSEVCYPAHEATVSSLLEASGAVASVAGIIVAQRVIDSGQASLVLVVMAGSSLAGATSMLCLSGRLRRREAEDDHLRASVEACGGGALEEGQPCRDELAGETLAACYRGSGTLRLTKNSVSDHFKQPGQASSDKDA